MRISAWRCLICPALVLFVAMPVFSDPDGDCFSIVATNSVGTGKLCWDASEMTWDPVGSYWYWDLTDAMDISSTSGTVLAVLDVATVRISTDPSVHFGFAVHAGASDTVFSITSALMTFPTITGAVGRATASFSLTDTNGNSATLTGQYGAGNAYLAQYNGFAGTQSGTDFSQLVSTFGVGPGQTFTSTDNDPLLGYRAVGGNPYDMSSAVSFKLTAHDLASGTNFYEIVPEPSSLALLGLGLLGLLRRRKSS